MRGIAQEDFSKFLKDSFVSVWVDNESAFGTYPLESMVSGTPVIGKVPNMIPEWMTEDNGIWTQNFNEIVDIIANFIQNWLEDNISEKLYDGMTTTVSNYTNKGLYQEEVINLFNGYYQKREESLSQQLEKINETEKIN
jgi:glycosyltransferase involved in cell wall biosynthesis